MTKRRERRRPIFWAAWGSHTSPMHWCRIFRMGSKSWWGARARWPAACCLWLGEPMAGVEGQSYEAMQRIVRDVADSGVAVCVVEHNVAFIRDICGGGGFMFAGAIHTRGL